MRCYAIRLLVSPKRLAGRWIESERWPNIGVKPVGQLYPHDWTAKYQATKKPHQARGAQEEERKRAGEHSGKAIKLRRRASHRRTGGTGESGPQISRRCEWADARRVDKPELLIEPQMDLIR